MFLEELVPLCQAIARQPIAFMGGFASAILKLDLKDEPLASWLASHQAEGQTIED